MNIRKHNRIWRYLCKELAYLEDNNYQARLIYNKLVRTRVLHAPLVKW